MLRRALPVNKIVRGGQNSNLSSSDRTWVVKLASEVTSPYNVAHNRVAKQIGGNVTFGETPKEFTMTLNMTEYREYWRYLSIAADWLQSRDRNDP